MFVVELFLPLTSSDGSPFSPATYDRIKEDLTDRFGGVTAFVRAPAEGLWKPGGDGVVRDQIAIFEVMVDEIEESWWRDYRRRLEREFGQDEILIRAVAASRL
jgi:hypothetical protein